MADRDELGIKEFRQKQLQKLQKQLDLEEQLDLEDKFSLLKARTNMPDNKLFEIVVEALKSDEDYTVFVDTDEIRFRGVISKETSVRRLHLQPCKILQDGLWESAVFVRVEYEDIRTWGLVSRPEPLTFAVFEEK